MAQTKVEKAFNQSIDRIQALLEKGSPFNPGECGELETLGRLATQLDDLKYRESHTTGAMSPAHEKRQRRKKRK